MHAGPGDREITDGDWVSQRTFMAAALNLGQVRVNPEMIEDFRERSLLVVRKRQPNYRSI